MSPHVKMRASNAFVVDDDPAIARVVAALIAGRGIRVVVAHSYAEAIAMEERFDVAVFDIDLGDGSGVDLAERMLAAGHIRQPLFLTGGVSQATLDRAECLGAVLQKPFDVLRVGELVQDLLNGGEVAEADGERRRHAPAK